MADTGDTDKGSLDGNTKTRSRYWIFTWNNYTEVEKKKLEIWSESECDKTVIQPEVGECGTPHLQGYWAFKNARYFTSLKKLWPKLHLERVRNIDAAIDYCQKTETKSGETFTTGFAEPVLDPLADVELYSWQRNLISELSGVPTRRSIH